MSAEAKMEIDEEDYVSSFNCLGLSVIFTGHLIDIFEGRYHTPLSITGGEGARKHFNWATAQFLPCDTRESFTKMFVLRVCTSGSSVLMQLAMRAVMQCNARQHVCNATQSNPFIKL